MFVCLSCKADPSYYYQYHVRGNCKLFCSHPSCLHHPEKCKESPPGLARKVDYPPLSIRCWWLVLSILDHLCWMAWHLYHPLIISHVPDLPPGRLYLLSGRLCSQLDPSSNMQKVFFCPRTYFWLRNVWAIYFQTLSIFWVLRVNITVFWVIWTISL